MVSGPDVTENTWNGPSSKFLREHCKQQEKFHIFDAALKKREKKTSFESLVIQPLPMTLINSSQVHQ